MPWLEPCAEIRLCFPAEAPIFAALIFENMKNIVVAVLLLFTLAAQAQKRKPVTKTGGAASAARPFKNLTDSASYALGMTVGTFYKQQGFKNLNTALIAKAIADVQAGKKPLFTEQKANECVMYFTNPSLRTTIEEGQKFLATNKTKTGVRSTPSGLQYEVIKEGAGAKPKAFDTVRVNYAGTLLNGTEFDNSYKRGEPIEFALNRVISGWTEGLQLMSPGAKYKFYIPYELGYGLNGNGPIPGGATLVFDVELLGIKPSR